MAMFSSQHSRRSEGKRNGAMGFLPRLESLEDRAVPAITVGPNIDVTQLVGDEMEVDIAVNPTNPNNIIVAPIDTTTLFTTGQDRVFVTFDGGTNWAPVTIPNPPGLFAFGDPTVVFDRTGRAVYAHLTSSFFFDLNLSSAVSTDGGLTWTASTVTPSISIDDFGGITFPADDKEFLAIGPDVNDLGRDRFYMGYQDANQAGVQMFVSSADGLTWTDPVRVSDTGNNGINSQIAVGNNGELYYIWSRTNILFGTPGVSPIFLDVSLDGGRTWGKDTTVATTNIDTFTDPGSFFGRYLIPAQPERGIGPNASIDVDRSFGPNRGTIYISFTDQADRDGSDDRANPTERADLDIFVVRSNDSGRTFSDPVRVNDDQTLTTQFQSWLDVDPITGAVGVLWYDARNDPANNQFVDVFFSVSPDGIHWEPNVRVSQGSSNEAVHLNFNDFLEYIGLEMYDGVAYMTWADNSNSTGNNPDGALDGLDTYFATARFTAPEVIVVDVSASMTAIDGFDLNGDGVLDHKDDVNGDGLRGTPLDIALHLALNSQIGLIRGEVSVMIMGRTTEVLDMSGVIGMQTIASANADSDGDGVGDLEQLLRSIQVGKGGGVFAPVQTVDDSRSFYENALAHIAAVVVANPALTDAVIYSDGSGRLPLISFGLADTILAGVNVDTVLVGPYQSTGSTIDFTRIATATGGTITNVTNLVHMRDGGYSPDRFVGTVTGLGTTGTTTLSPGSGDAPILPPGSALNRLFVELTDDDLARFREMTEKTTTVRFQTQSSSSEGASASLRNHRSYSALAPQLIDEALELDG